jgi:hypothetical protein
VTIRPVAPWLNDQIRDAKKEMRKSERVWRSTKLTVHRDLYKADKNNVTLLIDQSKQKYYTEQIEENTGNQKGLYKVVNQLLHRSNTSVLPKHTSSEELSNRFVSFFGDKVAKIRDELVTIQDQHQDVLCDSVTPTCKLSSFEPATEEEIQTLVMSAASKSCSLDPMPTWLLKDCLDALLPTITKIVNISLATSVMPTSMKEAIVTPLLKKASLDPELLKNYRPVSNLSFISKLVERVVAKRLADHMQTNNLHENMQSAYRQYHSTETALLKVQNDILCAIDDQNCVLLVLLDLSAAFDTVDHQILFDRLTKRCGVTGNAHKWFQSYLSDRIQAVQIEGSSSSKQDLNCGVPQGSVLGPILFSIYTAPLGDIVRSNNTNHHLYADDTQLYVFFKAHFASDAHRKVQVMENCVRDIRSWMAQNFLRLNDDKTEVLVIGTYQQLNKVSIPSVKIGEADIIPSQSARNIGCEFDIHLKLQKHVNNICKAAWFHLRNISKIRKHLDFKTTEMLIHAFISSKLDYTNCLLYGLPVKELKQLQRIQNAAARLVIKARKFDRATPILHTLHWLPVSFRIQYKILLITFKALHGQAPTYIADLLEYYNPSRTLRSSEKSLLKERSSKLVTYGERSFAHAAPMLWNSLPLEVRKSPTTEIFKSRLKTTLFKKAFR